MSFIVSQVNLTIYIHLHWSVLTMRSTCNMNLLIMKCGKMNTLMICGLRPPPPPTPPPLFYRCKNSYIHTHAYTCLHMPTHKHIHTPHTYVSIHTHTQNTHMYALELEYSKGICRYQGSCQPAHILPHPLTGDFLASAWA